MEFKQVEEFKAPFESFTSIDQVKGIFYEVSTDAGKMYFVASPSFYEGKWEFEEVEKDMVDNIN